MEYVTILYLLITVLLIYFLYYNSYLLPDLKDIASYSNIWEGESSIFNPTKKRHDAVSHGYQACMV